MTFHASFGDPGLVAIGAPFHRAKVSTHTDGALDFTVATPAEEYGMVNHQKEICLVHQKRLGEGIYNFG